MKDFHLQAELARPSVASVSEDLTKLYEKSEGTDVYLEYKGTQFSVHKSILCVRCPLFRELLGKIYTFGTVVPIQIDMPEITTGLFSDLLRYLYSGEIRGYTDADFDYQTLFRSLSKHVPNDLEFDLRHLLDTGIYSDVKLVFRNASSSANGPNAPTYNSTALHSAKSIGKSPDDRCTACSNPSEYSCHAAVLAARSRFFRNIILRYQNKNLKAENQTINTAKQSIRIVLDERHIPKRYIGAVLNAIYCDGSNIVNLLPNCVCKCRKNRSTNLLSASNSPGDELSELPFSSSAFAANSSTTSATTNNPFASTISNLTGSTIFQTISSSITSAEAAANKSENYINEIIDLFVIGKFLEVPTLTSVCETLLVEAISMDTVIGLLVWSERSNGSEFVRRQCLCFLREEYSTVATSKLLLQLSETQLIELIKSDFLQASEYEVLCSIFRWIESRLERDQPLTTSRPLDTRRTRFTEEDNALNSSLNSSHSTGSIKLNGSSNNGFSCTSSPGGPQTQTPKKCKRLSTEENADLERLRAMIGAFTKFLRIAHILPLENDLLKNALKNELITTLPPYMLNDDQTLSYERGIMAWINLENRPNFVKPRFFQPFYEEARLLLDERLTRFEEISFNDKMQIKKSSFNFPDNLYMVNESLSKSVNNKLSLGDLNETSNLHRAGYFVEPDLNGDRRIIRALKERLMTNRMQVDLDYLDKETKSSIRQCNTETYLQILPKIRALNLEEKYEILIYIQLKILREHNLPDEMLFIFEQDERSEHPLQTKQERGVLNMNLKRRSLKSSRRFSLNSVDLENYLSYESAENYKYHFERDEDNLFLRGLQAERPTGDYYEIRSPLADDPTGQPTKLADAHEQATSTEEANALNGPLLPPPDYRSYNESEFPNKEQEISLDVFI